MIFLWRLPVYSPRCNNANPVVTSKKLDVLTRFGRNFSRLAKLLYYPIQVYLNLLRMSRNMTRVVINCNLVKVCQNASQSDNCFHRCILSRNSLWYIPIHSSTTSFVSYKDLQSSAGWRILVFLSALHLCIPCQQAGVWLQWFYSLGMPRWSYFGALVCKYLLCMARIIRMVCTVRIQTITLSNKCCFPC